MAKINIGSIKNSNIKVFNKDLLEVDKRLSILINKYRLNESYYFLVPTNVQKEKEQFNLNIKLKKKYEPNFTYKLKVDRCNYETISRQIEEIKKDFDYIEFPKKYKFLKQIYYKKIKELHHFNRLISTIGKKGFTKSSKKCYGTPTRIEFVIAKTIIKIFRIKKYFFLNERNLTGKEIKQTFFEFQDKLKLDSWDILFSDNILSIAVLNSKDKIMTINKKEKFTNKQLRRLLFHELSVHAKRYENGRNNLKIFSQGTKGYDLLEEGLATYKELESGKIIDVLVLPSIKICAIYLALNNSFYDTYNKLCKITKDQHLALTYTLRAKRGTYKNKGAYTKDLIYFRGFFKVARYNLRNIYNFKNLNRLLIGKISFEDIKNIKEIKSIPSELKL